MRPRLWRRWIVALPGLLCLACLVLAHPGLARAQAEERPPEVATEHGASPPASPSQPPIQAPVQPPLPPKAPTTSSPRPLILFLPYVGFSLPVGEGWAGWNGSPRWGVLLGWHVAEVLSLNVECDVDYARTELGLGGQASGKNFWNGFWNPPMRYVDLALSPLVSLHAGQVRLGPRIGWFTGKGGTEEGIRVNGSGLFFGFNAGLFMPYRGVAIGGLLTGSFRFFTSADQTDGTHHTLGLLAAVLL